MTLRSVFYKARYSPQKLGEMLLNQINATPGSPWGDYPPGGTKIIKDLIAAGADLTLRDERGDTAFLRALGQSRLDIADVFIGLNRPDIIQARNNKPSDPTCKWVGGQTALLKYRDGNLPYFKKLAEAGAPIDEPDDSGQTPLGRALDENDPDIALYIVNHYPINLNKQNIEGNTYFYIALSIGHTNVARAMLAKGADIYLKNNNGESAIFCAMRGNDADALQLVLDAGADPNARDDHNGTPLMIGASHGTLRTVNWLCALPQTDLDAVDNDGDTASDCATLCEYPEVRDIIRGHQESRREAAAKQRAAEEKRQKQVGDYCEKGLPLQKAIKVQPRLMLKKNITP